MILQIIREAYKGAREIKKAQKYLQDIALTEEYLKTICRSVSEWSDPIAIEIKLNDGRIVTVRKDIATSETKSFRERYEEARRR